MILATTSFGFSVGLQRPAAFFFAFLIIVLFDLTNNHVIAVQPYARIELYSSSSSSSKNQQRKQQMSTCTKDDYVQCLTPIRIDENSLSASHAVFGKPLHFGKPLSNDYANRPRKLVQPPLNDPLLCQIRFPTTKPIPSSADDGDNDDSLLLFPFENYYLHKVILIPRGECNFERKALNAQELGADGIIIYNTLESRYGDMGEVSYINGVYIDDDHVNDSNSDSTGGNGRIADEGTNDNVNNGGNNQVNTDNGNSTNDVNLQNVVWPTRHVDFECENGSAWIPKEFLSFTNPFPYNATSNNPLLTGSGEDGNLCAQGDMSSKLSASSDEESMTFETQCESQRCLLTGSTKVVSDFLKQHEYMAACCAWDKYIVLGDDLRLGKDHVKIPSVFVTMKQGDWFLDLLRGSSTTPSVNELSNTHNGATDIIIDGGGGRSSSSGGDGTMPTTTNQEEFYVIMYERHYPIWNVSHFILWLVAVFATWISTYASALQLRRTNDLLENSDIRFLSNDTNGDPGRSNDNNRSSNRNENDVPSAVLGNEIEAVDNNVDNSRSSTADQQEQVATLSNLNNNDINDDEDLMEDDEGQQNLQECEIQNENTTLLVTNEESIEENNANNDQGQQPVRMEQSQQRASNNNNEGTTSPQFDVPPFDEYDADYATNHAFDMNRTPYYLSLGGNSRVLNATSFLIIASVILFILIFARVYIFMRVVYAVVAVFAGVKVLLYPSIQMMASFIGVEKQFDSPICLGLQCCGFDNLTWIDFICVVGGTVLGVTWIGYGFVVVGAGTHAFYWITKDILG